MVRFFCPGCWIEVDEAHDRVRVETLRADLGLDVLAHYIEGCADRESAERLVGRPEGAAASDSCHRSAEGRVTSAAGRAGAG